MSAPYPTPLTGILAYYRCSVGFSYTVHLLDTSYICHNSRHHVQLRWGVPFEYQLRPQLREARVFLWKGCDDVRCLELAFGVRLVFALHKQLSPVSLVRGVPPNLAVVPL